MARPKQYGPRVDTKVRIRQDLADALTERAEETGLARNRLVEQALDEFLNGKGKRPRLNSAPADPNITGTSQDRAQVRTKPKLHKIGEAQAIASQAGKAGTPPVIPPKTAKPEHGPAAPQRPQRRPRPHL